MTIYEIKYRISAARRDFFFDRSTMKFFGQTLKNFSVRQAFTGKNRFFHVRAPGRYNTTTYRLYDDEARDFVEGITSFKEAEKYLEEHAT